MIRFDQNECQDFAASTSREWLETNGLGGFASSTTIGLNTRRYHGLLIAAMRPPVERYLLLSKFEETLVIGEERHELSSNQYPDTIYPQGYRLQTEFQLSPFPVFTYRVGGIEIKKTVLMIHGQNTTLIQYDFNFPPDTFALHPSPFSFELRPLVACRDYHHTQHEGETQPPHSELNNQAVKIAFSAGQPTLHLAHNADEAGQTGFWYRNFEYAVERERGLDYREDLYNPCLLRFNLTTENNFSAQVIASTEPHEIENAREYREAEKLRRQTARASLPAVEADELTEALAAAADQFVVARGEEKTIIAGYHWFSDWGRDTMIALPGLTLTTERAEVARSILLAFAHHIDCGMLPNRFPDAGETPEYNTVDATLWYFEAVRALVSATGDHEFVHRYLYDQLAEIIAWHVRGTRYNIRVDDDGLLACGAEGTQLTWMDAKVGDWVVTPRRGKPVEIQALWYNALRVMEDFAHAFGEPQRENRYREMARRAEESFNEKFWNESAACLYDVIDPAGHADPAMRPNQILAVSLPFSMLSAERAPKVVAAVERDLLTPYGLRTLAAYDPQYRGRYEGDTLSRDGAYHQGTVWAWLMGPFVTAYLKTHNSSAEARQRVARLGAGFQAHLREAGLGQISEIFDGDAPHTPRGCIAQAWSVGELLRAITEGAHK